MARKVSYCFLESGHLLTGVLVVLTSFFNWSSSIFKISLSDISRAILTARGNQDQHVKMKKVTWFVWVILFKSFDRINVNPAKTNILNNHSFTFWMVGSPKVWEMCWLLRAHRLSACLSSGCFFTLTDPCCPTALHPRWSPLLAFGRGRQRIGLMSPIPPDEIKQSGAVTSEQEGR